ncbi:MAG: sugar O-acetyltransferase [Ruminococcaceae bacterium]|nr:sugar O-acetyltransferase [Oscillospiraceae bacterium]
MTQRERRDLQLPYISDESVYEEQKRARILTQKLNTMDRSDFEGIQKVIQELLQTEETLFINPPFYCDYGNHIKVGKNFFANYNCCILDVGKVTIGDNCLFAPNVSIYTAGHPIHPDARNSLYEYGIDVTLGNNCWLGGNVIVMPGVNIGDNCVIGAGSVVTKDIPAWSIAAGNPARVIRKITEEDKKYYFKDREFDPESWAAINGKEE